MTKYTDTKVNEAKKTQQMIKTLAKEPVGVQFLFMGMICTRWFQPDGSLSVVGPEHAANIIKPYVKVLDSLFKEHSVLELIEQIESEGVHNVFMIKHAYIEVLTDRCMKLAKAGLANEWPHVSERDVRNTLAEGFSFVVPQEQQMNKAENRQSNLNTELKRALQLLDESPDGLTESQLSAYGVTKETMETLVLLDFVK